MFWNSGNRMYSLSLYMNFQVCTKYFFQRKGVDKEDSPHFHCGQKFPKAISITAYIYFSLKILLMH